MNRALKALALIALFALFALPASAAPSTGLFGFGAIFYNLLYEIRDNVIYVMLGISGLVLIIVATIRGELGEIFQKFTTFMIGAALAASTLTFLSFVYGGGGSPL